MENKIKLIIISLIIGILFLSACGTSITGNTVKGEKATVYKSNSCGCCGNYVSYLTKLGFDVEVINLEELSGIKKKYNIPQSMESCHTTIIGDYFIEGHMPIEAINKLSEEKPDIDGIAMPGMPSGSPGMPGSKSPFVIYSVKDGNFEKYMEL